MNPLENLNNDQVYIIWEALTRLIKINVKYILLLCKDNLD